MNKLKQMLTIGVRQQQKQEDDTCMDSTRHNLTLNTNMTPPATPFVNTTTLVTTYTSTTTLVNSVCVFTQTETLESTESTVEPAVALFSTSPESSPAFSSSLVSKQCADETSSSSSKWKVSELKSEDVAPYGSKSQDTTLSWPSQSTTLDVSPHTEETILTSDDQKWISSIDLATVNEFFV